MITENEKNILKASLLGPITVFPSAILFITGTAIHNSTFDTTFQYLISCVIASTVIYIIACFTTVTYGVVFCLILIRLGGLKLQYLMAGTLLPTFLAYWLSKNTEVVILAQYCGSIICVACWYLGLKKIKVVL